jgi:hypothetical protein
VVGYFKKSLINKKTMVIFKQEKIITFSNRYGEVMTMKRDLNGNLLVHHEDCNKDFELLTKFTSNYILNQEELVAITEFIKECNNIQETELV